MINAVARFLLFCAVLVSASLAAAETFCGGERLAIETRTGGSAPYIDLTLNGRTGPFLVDYAATASGVERGMWQFEARARSVRLRGLSLPSWSDQDVLYEIHDRNIAVGNREQHGVIGVDLLQGQVLEFHYERPADRYVSIGAFGARCGVDLAARGFRRVGQGRYWVDGGASDAQPANVPVIYWDIAHATTPDQPVGIDGWAQIDTGYDDTAYPFSIEINQAMYDHLIGKGVALTEIGAVSVVGCTGAAEQRRAFQVRDHVLRVETDAGEAIVSLETFTFILKHDSASCGGIGADSRPGAQIGASFLHSFGVTVFSGPTKEVWIRPTPQRPQ